MVLVYIFDLDDTLYQDYYLSNPNFYPENATEYEKYYSKFKPDLELKSLLDKLDAPKYILTNATYEHADTVLERLNIREHFKDIIARDTMGTMKPRKEAYQFIMGKVMLKEKKSDLKYLFFDDLKKNLKMAKYMGWRTCLIKRLNNDDLDEDEEYYIDYKFSNIKEALRHFINVCNYTLNINNKMFV